MAQPQIRLEEAIYQKSMGISQKSNQENDEESVLLGKTDCI